MQLSPRNRKLLLNMCDDPREKRKITVLDGTTKEFETPQMPNVMFGLVKDVDPLMTDKHVAEIGEVVYWRTSAHPEFKVVVDLDQVEILLPESAVEGVVSDVAVKTLDATAVLPETPSPILTQDKRIITPN